jgi:hypothetical protein
MKRTKKIKLRNPLILIVKRQRKNKITRISSPSPELLPPK